MKRSKKMFTVMLALCVALSMAMASVTANAATKKDLPQGHFYHSGYQG